MGWLCWLIGEFHWVKTPGEGISGREKNGQ